MSHMVTRKGPMGDDKDRKQTASPVKEMKKKIAANAEKEKLAAEKQVDKAADKQAEKTRDDNLEKKDKPAERHLTKAEKKEKGLDKSPETKDKSADKKDKSGEKSTDKSDKSADKTVEKHADKKEKTADKHGEKSADKNADKKENCDKKEHAEKSKDDGSSTEQPGKPEREEEKARRADIVKHNGAQNGNETNGTVSESDDEELIIVDQENDEMFPELAYDDTSDVDGFDPDTPSRSLTRRSQVKVTRTPETPRPASDKQTDKETDDSKEPKLLKLKEDIALTDRRLRSANSPKPSEKRSQEKDSPKKSDPATKAKLEEPSAEDTQEKTDQKSEVVEIAVVIEVENNEDGEPARRDTKFSRSRVKVSPYRRSARLADNTANSVLANYTGNNTTMEMDITESSFVSEEPSTTEDSYLSALRSIRGRRSYKSLKPLTLSNISINLSQQSAASLNNLRESGIRPTGTVVGRKRRPDTGAPTRDDAVEPAPEEDSEEGEAPKRPRLLDRLARPFRMHSTPLPARRAAEIVGINTDLPLTAPVAADGPFDPETIKSTSTPAPTLAHKPTPTLGHAPPAAPERDNKRCVVM